MNININIDKIKKISEKLKTVLHKPNEQDADEEKETLTFTYNDSDVKDIINYISDRIVGQEDVIKTLISNILYNQILIDEINSNEEYDHTQLDARKTSILVEGPTGTGKTAIINDIASRISIPVSITNVTHFFETRYVNETTNSILCDLLLKAEGDTELAERGIVVLDEIEKIANNADYNSRDARKSVQEEIIALMNGDEYEVTIQSDDQVVSLPFDTSKLTFIMIGNFNKLKNKRANDDSSTATIGFASSINIDNDNNNNSIKNYIKSETIPGFFEKIRVVANTKKYDVSDYENILLNSKISPLIGFTKTIKKFEYKSVKYDPDLVNKLAKDAYDMGIGARGLQILMSEVQNNVLYDIMMKQYDKNETILLTDKTTKSKQRVRK